MTIGAIDFSYNTFFPAAFSFNKKFLSCVGILLNLLRQLQIIFRINATWTDLTQVIFSV